MGQGGGGVRRGDENARIAGGSGQKEGRKKDGGDTSERRESRGSVAKRANAGADEGGGPGADIAQRGNGSARVKGGGERRWEDSGSGK